MASCLIRHRQAEMRHHRREIIGHRRALSAAYREIIICVLQSIAKSRRHAATNWPYNISMASAPHRGEARRDGITGAACAANAFARARAAG